MKKTLLVLFAMGILGTSFISCREDKSTKDKLEDVADDIEDSVD
ncbi:hypothetical protein [Aquimarina intermedia]|uniref:Uncharacterized protein n=1 Tax=Aquimarina intermedia TaxID=350814 RepID=A0A5S5BV12_9FLAO|nr:hypothetical protein [Aquimarina intermedia]TYP71011.1 hypothetical protein BD809_11070 [Aquimarina intermedia]